MNWADNARIVDVSHWQAEEDRTGHRLMDWGMAVRSGLVGAIVKYSTGDTGVDPAAFLHAYSAYKAGVALLGAYHFGTAADPLKQAAHFLDLVHQDYGTLNGGVMLMLDAEPYPASQMSVRQAEIFVTAVHGAAGRWPWLYTGRSGPDGTGKGLPSKILSRCPLLLPAYGKHPDLAPALPPGWRVPKDGADRGELGMGVVRGWQFTDGTANGGPFPGLGKVDQSRLIGVSSLVEARQIWVG